MAVEGTKRRQIARVASDTVESDQIVGLFLEVHHHLDRLLQLARVLLCLGRVAQQVLQYRDVVVNATPRPPQVLTQSQRLIADLSNGFCIVLSIVRVSVKSYTQCTEGRTVSHTYVMHSKHGTSHVDAS